MTTLWTAVFVEHMLGLSLTLKIGASTSTALSFGLLLYLVETELSGSKKNPQIPVTIVTGTSAQTSFWLPRDMRFQKIAGWLGAGKTTLVSHILREAKGLRILVVENEVSSEGVCY